MRSQFLLGAGMFSPTPISPITSASSFNLFPGTLIYFCGVLPPARRLQKDRVCARDSVGSLELAHSQALVLTLPALGFPCRCSASSRACPSPWPASPSTTPWCLGSSVTHRGSSASTSAGSLGLAHPTACRTCSWPAWWPAWSLLGWARPWTSSRSGCRCRRSHSGKVRGRGRAPDSWTPGILS